MTSPAPPTAASASGDLIDGRADNPLLGPLRAAVHHGRVLGYIPLVLWSLVRRPVRTLQGVTAYYALRFRSPHWRRLIRYLLACGSSRQPRLIRA